MDKSKHNKGFSLIGVMLSLTIAVVIMTAVAGLLARSEEVVELSRNKFIAINIAREGLELSRVQRDNNAFVEEDWTAEICNDENPRDYTIDVNTDGEINIEESTDGRLYVNNGIWSHDSDGEESAYSRTLSVECENKDNDPTDDTTGNPYVNITSKVSWQSRGQDEEITVKEKLYDWITYRP